MKPVMAAAAASTEAREEELVARAKAGNSQAFEALFRRYRERIASFVRASVRDEGRTEDLVQEIFISAHRSLPALDHASAFRPWLYQIARNACLDEARRRSRQDELILGWEEFPPPDEQLIVYGPSAERTLSQKEELANLTQALDGLPESQHEALVLREIAGLSYEEIGRRMRLSRPAVESVLFRARRGLKGEFSEITTGERCKQMHTVMAEVSEGLGGLRERRKLIRHMRDCVSCRREAAALGLAGLAVPSDARSGLQKALSRAAAFLPFPVFFSRRAEQGEQLAGSGGSSAANVSSLTAQAQSAASQLTAVGGDHAASVIHKAAAVVAAVAVVGGGGVAAIERSGVKIPVIQSGGQKKHEPAAARKDLPVAHRLSDAGGAPPDSTHKGAAPAGAPQPAQALGGAGTAPSTDTTTPAAGVAPTDAAPGGTTAPDTTAPDSSPPASAPDATTPADGGATPPSDSGGTGSDGSTVTPSGGTPPVDATPPPAADPPPSDPLLDSLPPGIASQIRNGKRTLDSLPPGLKKKLG